MLKTCPQRSAWSYRDIGLVQYVFYDIEHL